MTIELKFVLTSRLLANIFATAFEGNHYTYSWLYAAEPKGDAPSYWYANTSFFDTEGWGAVLTVRDPLRDMEYDATYKFEVNAEIFDQALAKLFATHPSAAGDIFGDGWIDGASADLIFQIAVYGKPIYG